MSDVEEGEFSREQKISALLDVARYEPRWTAGIILFGILTAFLEGIGLSFILPLIRLMQSSSTPTADGDGLLRIFVVLYQWIGVPLTIQSVITGVGAVLTVRYTMSFAVAWLRSILRTEYTRYLQQRAFGSALNARIQYFDEEGSDDILNAVITQTFYGGRVIQQVVLFLSQLFIAATYFCIAFVISPALTALTGVVLGVFTLGLRNVLEPGYDLGERVAKANEQRQQAVQVGIQGIRDIKLFGVVNQIYEDFDAAIETYTSSRIRLRRNQAAINNFYDLLIAVFVFLLIYVSYAFSGLSLSALGVFLFAVFRLGPKVSSLNTKVYQIENDLPHLIRTIEFIDELEQYDESIDASRAVPKEITQIQYDNVRFSYEKNRIIRGVNFEITKGESVGIVGSSGAGKSTLITLLIRMYKPDSGEIRANGVPISKMDITEWRDHIAVVRQDPYIFNNTLRYNLTIGCDTVSDKRLDEICEITQISEFKGTLSHGYETLLGDNGVRLSGGQRQRVALARALLKDADVLVLDEATSDLDSDLEKEVQQAIQEINRNYTLIMISHRLSIMEDADQIYIIEDGKISESGRHEDLMDNDGKYAELYAIQSE